MAFVIRDEPSSPVSKGGRFVIRDEPPKSQSARLAAQKIGVNPQTGQPEPPQESVDRIAGMSAMGRENPNLYGAVGAGYQVGKSAAEMAGMVGGGALGGAAGTAVMPGAGTWVGGVGGAGAGYAYAKELAQRAGQSAGLEPENKDIGTLEQRAMNVGEGVALELGGKALGAIAGGVGYLAKAGWKMLEGGSAVKEGVANRLPPKFAKDTPQGTIYADNAEEALRIDKELGGGGYFTPGQMMNDPAQMAYEKGRVAVSPNAMVQAETKTSNLREAVRDNLEKTFPAERGGIEDVLARATEKGQSLAKGVETAKESLGKETARLESGMKGQEVGGTIRSVTKEKKAAAYAKKEEMFNALPDAPVTDAKTVVQSLNRAMKEGEFLNNPESSNIPWQVAKITKDFEVSGNSNFGFKRLNSLRSGLDAVIREERAKANPNGLLITNAVAGKEKVVQLMDEMGNKDKYGAIADQYSAAKKFYTEEYAPFKKGAVSEILQPGLRGEKYKMESQDVAAKFFNEGKLDSADQFIKTLGGEAQARQAIKDHASRDLLDTVTKIGASGESELSTKGLGSWMQSHKEILDKFGLAGEFSNVTKAQKAVDLARASEGEYGKSVAAKLLGADPEKAITEAFGSGRKTRQTAQELMDMVKGSPKAEAGLQKSFADFVVQKAKGTAETMGGDPTIRRDALVKAMDSYRPAMEVFYKDSPEKLKLLQTVQKAYQISSRKGVSSLAAGSDTEMKRAAALFSSFVPHSWSVKTAHKLLTWGKEEEINILLDKAAFDYETADLLRRIATGKIEDPLARASFKKLLSRSISLETSNLVKGKNQ